MIQELSREVQMSVMLMHSVLCDTEVLKTEGECIVAVTLECARTLDQISPTTLPFFFLTTFINNTFPTSSTSLSK